MEREVRWVKGVKGITPMGREVEVSVKYVDGVPMDKVMKYTSKRSDRNLTMYYSPQVSLREALIMADFRISEFEAERRK